MPARVGASAGGNNNNSKKNENTKATTAGSGKERRDQNIERYFKLAIKGTWQDMVGQDMTANGGRDGSVGK